MSFCTCWNKQRLLRNMSNTQPQMSLLWESEWTTAAFMDALIIVEVGDSQAVSKVRAHLFPRNDEIQRDIFVSLLPEHHGPLGLSPRRPRQHRIIVTALQFFRLQNWVTCGWRHISTTSWKQDLTKIITLFIWCIHTQDIYPYNYSSFSARQSLLPQSPRHLLGQGLSRLHERFLKNKTERKILCQRWRTKWIVSWISVCKP